MREPTQRADTIVLARLKSELTAIELWDRHYYQTQEHDAIDEDAHRQRQERREELLGEILRIAGADPRVFRLSFL